MADKGFVQVKVAAVDKDSDFCGDGQGQFGIVLSGESKGAIDAVIVGRAEAGGRSGADGEIRTQQEPEPEVRRRGGHQGVDFGRCDGDVSGPHVRIAAHVLFKVRRAVFVLQPAQETSQRIRLFRFGLVGIGTTVNLLVEFEDEGRCELMGKQVTSFRDESFGDGADGVGRVLPMEVGAEEWANCPSAFLFGWAMAFWSNS